MIGFPHSEIHGSKPVHGSPQLIAVCHVLHRLSTPRHPPNALIALDYSHCHPAWGINALARMARSVCLASLQKRQKRLTDARQDQKHACRLIRRQRSHAPAQSRTNLRLHFFKHVRIGDAPVSNRRIKHALPKAFSCFW